MKRLPTVDRICVQVIPPNKFKMATVHYLDGLPHREDGPAMIPDGGGPVKWALDGCFLTFDEWMTLSPADDELKVMLKLTYG